MRNWKSQIRKACETIAADPEKYWLEGSVLRVGNILIKSNVYSGMTADLGPACYTIPLYRVMYKTERGWLFNCNTVDEVISQLQEKLDFRI